MYLSLDLFKIVLYSEDAYRNILNTKYSKCWNIIVLCAQSTCLRCYPYEELKSGKKRIQIRIVWSLTDVYTSTESVKFTSNYRGIDTERQQKLHVKSG